MKSKMKITSLASFSKLFLLAIFILVYGSSFAQKKKQNENRTSDQKIEAQVTRLTKDLGLDEKQVVEVKKIIEKRVVNRDAFQMKKGEMQQANKEEKKALRTTMKAEQEALKADMKAVLTPDQFAKWEENRDHNKEKMMEKRIENKKDKK